ncbi:hypothetical protein F967_01017, partial [Acinetobacter sp. CIP 102637]
MAYVALNLQILIYALPKSFLNGVCRPELMDRLDICRFVFLNGVCRPE